MSRLPQVSDWKLERYLLQELPPEEMRAIEARLPLDRELAARLRALEASNAAILAATPPAEAAAAIRLRAHRDAVLAREASRKGRRRVAFGLAPALAAAVLAVMSVSPVMRPVSEPAGETVRFKGMQARIVLYRQGHANAEPLAERAEVREGDVLQVAYVAAGQAYGAVVSIDGRGAVTLHLPEAEGPAAKLEAGGETPLAHAYELDDAPGYERFFLVTGTKPFAASEVLQAARLLASDPHNAKTAALTLPAGLEQTSLLLVKE